MPPSSLYCCQRSVSSVSSAARNRRIAPSPGVRPPLARAFGGSANSRPAPTVAAPATAPLSKKERRLLRCSDRSVASMVFLLLESPCLPKGGFAEAGLGLGPAERAAAAGPAGRRRIRRRASLPVLRRSRVPGFAPGGRQASASVWFERATQKRRPDEAA